MNDFHRVIRAAIEQEGGMFFSTLTGNNDRLRNLRWPAAAARGASSPVFEVLSWNKDACIEHSIHRHLSIADFRFWIHDKDLLDPGWAPKMVLKQAQVVMERVQLYQTLGKSRFLRWSDALHTNGQRKQ